MKSHMDVERIESGANDYLAITLNTDPDDLKHMHTCISSTVKIVMESNGKKKKKKIP